MRSFFVTRSHLHHLVAGQLRASLRTFMSDTLYSSFFAARDRLYQSASDSAERGHYFTKDSASDAAPRSAHLTNIFDSVDNLVAPGAGATHLGPRDGPGKGLATTAQRRMSASSPYIEAMRSRSLGSYTSEPRNGSVEGAPATGPRHQQIFFFFSIIEDIFVQMFSAIDYMHSKEVIHRDIKPANILLMTPKDKYPIHVCVADFGLAQFFEKREPSDAGSAVGSPAEDGVAPGVVGESGKALRVEGEERGGLRRTASSSASEPLVVGTFQYMAPETFAKATGKKSDIWSIGIILYEVIFGHKPFTFEVFVNKFF